MASKLFDAKSLELDESGKAKDFDNLVFAAKTEYADVISTKPAGSGYTPPAGTPPNSKADLGSLSMEDYIAERSKQK